MSVALVMQDRRQSPRLSYQLPVSITSLSRYERSCMSRDISVHGMLIDSDADSAFALGEEVTVTFPSPRGKSGSGMMTATGMVVRIARQHASDDSLPNVTAIRFDRPVEALAAN